MNRNPLDVIKENNSELFQNVTATRALAFQEGALPAKYKYLIALAMDADHGAADGVKSLAKQALEAGATKEEIFETLQTAFYIAGAGSVYTAARALNELF